MPTLSADGTAILCNGRLTPTIAKQCGFSQQGCAYRGTTWCTTCPWGRLFALWDDCNYRCDRCAHWPACPCGDSALTAAVERWFGIEEEIQE